MVVTGQDGTCELGQVAGSRSLIRDRELRWRGAQCIAIVSSCWRRMWLETAVGVASTESLGTLTS